MKKTFFGGIVAAAVLSLGAVAFAGDIETAPSHLTIKAGQTGGTLQGRLSSPNSNCEPNRKVRVYQKQPGHDPKVGVDRTNHNGHWKIHNGTLASGAWYARVKQKIIGQSLICLKDRSPVTSAG